MKVYTRLNISLLILINYLLAEEIKLHEIPLAGPITNRNQEISGMDWYNEILFLLPENDNGFLFTIAKDEIIKSINSSEQEPINPIKTSFNTNNISNRINGFDGFEAICFYNDIVYVTIEAEYEGLMYGYLIWGRISSDNYDINFPEENFLKRETPVNLKNFSYESVLHYDSSIYMLYEANGKKLQKDVKQIQVKGNFIFDVEFPNIEYRLTDATKVDSNNMFWCINYFWPGDKDILRPVLNYQIEESKLSDSGVRLTAVERLVEFQIEGDNITLSGSKPINIALNRESPRNWEAIARLDNNGFLVATDKHPRMILGYLKYD